MGLAVGVMVGLEAGEVLLAWEVGKAKQVEAAARHRPGECLLVSASEDNMKFEEHAEYEIRRAAACKGAARGRARGRIVRAGSIRHVVVWQGMVRRKGGACS